MEAKTLPKKKTINKGKIKKSIKNVLFRPDSLHWPQLAEDDAQDLESALSMHRVKIPVFTKPHWNELQEIPKEKRPKPPALPKVEGLIFGMSECSNAVQNGLSSAVIIEAEVVPRTIVQPTIEACVRGNIPVVCLTGLRKICSNYFGIRTSCLCIKKEHLPDLQSKLLTISNKYKPKKIIHKKEIEPMDVDITKEDQKQNMNNLKTEFTYLYRPNSKTRAFIPPDAKLVGKNDFSGQSFIGFSKNQDLKPKSTEFMRMSVKKILGNTNRTTRKKP